MLPLATASLFALVVELSNPAPSAGALSGPRLALVALGHAPPANLVSLPLAHGPDAPPPSERDSDCDGLTDEEEERLRHGPAGARTDPLWPDTDLDGITDGAELGRTTSVDARCHGVVLDTDPSTTSSPVLADSDGDGLPDGYEDRNRNGKLDPGETSPTARDSDLDLASDAVERLAGTHPARNAFNTIPEPMIYDLVRGLDAEAGEVEVNALVRILPHSEGTQLFYAPEIELALLDGFAIELELPLANERLEAVKAAMQATLVRGENGRWGHGLQLLGEAWLHEPGMLVALTHIGQARLGERWTLGTIIGPELVYDQRALRLHAAALVNATLGYAVAPLVVTALESNLLIDDAGGLAWRATPQVHVQVNHHFRMQMGMGVEGTNGRAAPLIATRMILEL